MQVYTIWILKQGHKSAKGEYYIPPKEVLRILWHWAQHIHVFGVTTKVA
jgi:hypothetical protein